MSFTKNSNKPDIIIQGDCEQTEKEMYSIFNEAINAINRFAKSYDWAGYIKEPFINEAIIFNKQKELIKYVSEITGTDEGKFPDKFSAVIFNKAMYILTPAEYKKVYPEGEEKGSYKKLIVHELAHQLHVRILQNNEEAMGPGWFYEGFAIFAAGQFKDFKLTPEEVWEVIRKESKKKYKYYGAVFRYFLNKSTLSQLVNKAGEKNFTEWLKKI